MCGLLGRQTFDGRLRVAARLSKGGRATDPAEPSGPTGGRPLGGVPFSRETDRFNPQRYILPILRSESVVPNHPTVPSRPRPSNHAAGGRPSGAASLCPADAARRCGMHRGPRRLRTPLAAARPRPRRRSPAAAAQSSACRRRRCYAAALPSPPDQFQRSQTSPLSLWPGTACAVRGHGDLKGRSAFDEAVPRACAPSG